MLTDSIKIHRRELRHYYIKEFEKKMLAEEGGENFDKSTLEKIGREIDNLKAVLGNVSKDEENITGKETNPDTKNSNNKSNNNNTCSRTHFKTKIPLPI